MQDISRATVVSTIICKSNTVQVWIKLVRFGISNVIVIANLKLCADRLTKQSKCNKLLCTEIKAKQNKTEGFKNFPTPLSHANRAGKKHCKFLQYK